jgi:GAF domain-containing protein
MTETARAQVHEPPEDAGGRERRRRLDGAGPFLFRFAATASLPELLTSALDLAEELTGSRIGFFHFVEDDQRSLSLQAWSSNTVARMCTAEGSGQHYPLSDAGVWADCVRTGRPVVHNDYASLPGRRGLPAGHAQVTRELVVPVARAGRIVAVLGVGNKLADYDERDVEDVSTSRPASGPTRRSRRASGGTGASSTT